MTQRRTQDKDRTPDSFDQDLHRDAGLGINHNPTGANPEQSAPTAVTLKELHNLIPDFTNDELGRIVVLQQGDVLEQGAKYIDLRHMDRGEFTADRPEEVGPPNLNLFIPKQQTDYVLWNRLLGVENPERIDQADDSSVS